MPLPTTIAAIAAEARNAGAIQSAKSPAQVQREFIADQYRRALTLLTGLKARRRWLAEAERGNPGLRAFYSDNADLTLAAVARHRRAIKAAKVRIASMPAERRAA
jgi:hypothetical protein